jgi:mannosyl-oligosaccharide alpha-1,2-mannosidase
MKLSSASLVLGLLSLTPLISAEIPIRGKHIADADVSRRQAVKDEFIRNWNAYNKVASGFDKLSPVRGGGYDDDTLMGWKGTVVESLSTMIVLGLQNTPDYQKALDIVKSIDFTKTKKGNPVGVVSLFEVTIRYIGGMLSAYQLNGEKKEEYFLVEQAKILADGLIAGWDVKTGNKIPFNSVNINLKKPNDVTNIANLAEAGTLTMEWGMLSKYTGDPKYAKLTQGSVDAIISTPGYWPNVWPSHINPISLKPESQYISTGGATDSFIEYLLKFPVLMDQPDHQYAQVYSKIIDTFKEKLVSKTSQKK